GAARPGIPPRFTRTRDRVKRPAQLAGMHVVCPDVPGRRRTGFGRTKANDDQSLVDDARRSQRHIVLGEIARKVLPQVDRTVIAEAPDWLTGLRIEGVEIIHDPRQQSALLPVASKGKSASCAGECR